MHDHHYQQSYLLKAGVRFDFNVVDTVCHRKLGLSFYLALISSLLLFGCLYGHQDLENISSSMRLLLMSLMFVLLGYVVLYLLRYSYYLRLRVKLRADQAPIAVESYAVVCLDLKVKFFDYVLALISKILGQGEYGFCKYAVLYKELGTNNPRFFLTKAVSARKLCFVPEHVGRVFIHRKKSYLYSLDDSSAYQTVSRKHMALRRFAMPDSASLSSSNKS